MATGWPHPSIQRWNSRTLFCALSVAVLAAAPASPAAADEFTARYFEQLRSHRLFVVAEGYCVDRLAGDKLSPPERAELTLEFSRTLSEHAKFARPDAQQELWDRAAIVIDEFLKATPNVAWRWHLQLQRALVPAARADFLRWQAELVPQAAELREQARAGFQQSIKQLEKIEQPLQARFKGKPRQTDALDSYEVRSLLETLHFEEARAQLGLAHLSPPGSAERAEFVQAAEALLGELKTDVPGHALASAVPLLLAECCRLRGDADRANFLLTQIESSEPPAAILDQSQAQRVRLDLEQDQPDEAAKKLVAYRALRGNLPGELRYLEVKSLAALAAVAEGRRDKNLAAELRTEIESRVERTVREVGGYWAARCQVLLDFSQRAARYGTELAEIVQLAESHYREGQHDAALEQYARATATALRRNKPELAAEFAYTRASILLQDKQYEAAAEAFHEIVERAPDSSRTPSAHLMWAYCLGSLYDQKRTASRREAYTRGLMAHRERFAGDATIHEATWMLAQLEERRLQTSRALALYLEIPQEHTRGEPAQTAIVRCYETILARLRAEKSARAAAWEEQAIERISQIVATFPEPTAWNPAQAQIALRLARLHLEHQPRGYVEADGLLERVMQSQAARPSATSDELSTEWRGIFQQAAQLRIVSLAGQGRYSQARALVDQLSQTDTDDLLRVLDGLLELSAHSDAASRRALGELQLWATEELRDRRSELDDAQLERLDRCLAEAYTATGMTERAIETYERLLIRSPADRKVLEAVARLLFECGTQECLQRAKTHWRKLESLGNAGDPDWLAARYEVARCCFELGQFDECRKLVIAVQVLYPELGGETLKAQFEALRLRLDQQTRR